MHKNAFFEINWKIATALGAPPPTPLASGGWGLRPRVVILITCYSYFSKAFVALSPLLSKRT